MSGYCHECGESHDECVITKWVSGCSCVASAVREIKAAERAAADERVTDLLEAIGSLGECKKCGEEVFFVLHHSDRGENPKAGFANKRRWRKWMRFDPNGERHKCAE